jgi:hypothetical protein
MEENLLMPIDMPETNEKKKKPRINILQDIFLELLEERKVTLSQVQKATEIKWGTLMGWHDGSVRSQMADKNLLRLAQFFNVSLEYLCFGIGDDSEAYEKFEEESRQ